MTDPKKLLNWAEVSRSLANDRSAITRKRIPEKHKEAIEELLKCIEAWQKGIKQRTYN